jgi:hypothetical protein
MKAEVPGNPTHPRPHTKNAIPNMGVDS